MPKQTNKPKINQTRKPYVKSTPLAKTSRTQQGPAISRVTSNGVVYKHREYLTQISTSTSFDTAGRFLVNPGNVNMFPWLSNIAVAFEKFRIINLNFEYQHQCPFTIPGFVGGYFEYDALDATQVNLSDLMNNMAAESGAPYDDFKVKYRKQEESLKSYYIASGSTLTTQDMLTYYPAEFRLYTQDGPTTSTVTGMLYVNYEIELMIPNVNAASVVQNSIYAQYNANIGYGPFDMKSAWYAMGKNIVTTTTDGNNFTLGKVSMDSDDWQTKNRVVALPPESYTDFWTAANNSTCLYFDNPGVYEVQMNYEYSTNASTPVFTTDFPETNMSGCSSASVLLASNEIVGTGSDRFVRISMSLFIIAVDVGARFAWKWLLTADPSLRIRRVFVHILEIGSEMVQTMVLEIYQRAYALASTKDPKRDKIRTPQSYRDYLSKLHTYRDYGDLREDACSVPRSPMNRQQPVESFSGSPFPVQQPNLGSNVHQLQRDNYFRER
jgi:hypothetical protein